MSDRSEPSVPAGDQRNSPRPERSVELFGADGAFQPEINAITLITRDMAASVAFYSTVGLELLYGGASEPFTSFGLGTNFLNISAEDGGSSGLWGRVIVHVASPDEMWNRLTAAGYSPSFSPSDAPWGERYFHILDPDGHEISFARRLE